MGEVLNIKGVYHAQFLMYRNLANLWYQSLELSNDRCPGCDIFIPFMWHAICVLCGVGNVYSYRRGLYVVCSTLIGSARASIRGMDNCWFHVFFVSKDCFSASYIIRLTWLTLLCKLCLIPYYLWAVKQKSTGWLIHLECQKEVTWYAGFLKKAYQI